MSILVIRPTATGTASASPHVVVGDTPNWKCVDESSSDADTTYLQNVAFEGETPKTLSDTMNCANSTGQVGVIKSVTISVRARYHTLGLGSPTVATRLRTNNVSYNGTARALTALYADYTQVYTSNPQTGAAWTWAQIDALQIGCTSFADKGGIADEEVRITQIWASVDYHDVFIMGVQDATMAALQPQFVMAEPSGYPARLSAMLTLTNSQSAAKSLAVSSSLTSSLVNSTSVAKSLSRSSAFALDLTESNSITGDF